MRNESSQVYWSGPWPELLYRGLGDSEEPGAVEVGAAVDALGNGQGRPVRLVRIKPRVYRLEFSGGAPGSLICKRLEPAAAQRMRLVVQRWLPALELENRCPGLLGQAAERGGACIWQLYEDLGDDTLASAPRSDRITAAVDLVAELHTRGAGHAILPEIRHHGRDFGVPYFMANVRDALRALDALRSAPLRGDAHRARVRLLDRLRALQSEAPDRTQCVAEAGGPETVLHGDLWTTNVLVAGTTGGPVARLIDWDRIGIGPFSYDLSAFLYRFPPVKRAGIVERYRQRVERAGWELPGVEQLNVLFDTAEQARYANCVAWTVVAWVQDRAEWAPAQLVEIAEWFDALEPVLTPQTA